MRRPFSLAGSATACAGFAIVTAFGATGYAQGSAAVEAATSPTPAPATPTIDEAKAAAEPATDKSADRAWETAKPEHRGGFTAGLALAGGIGASNGYPADAKKVGRYDFYTESGLGFMGASGVWIGGALADWLTFGAGGGYSTIVNGDTMSPAPYFFFHSDVYPLFPLGGQWRNLGAMLQFGLGFPVTTSSETEEKLIDGTGASFILAGVFWEGIEAWKLKMGPYLATHYMFSDTVRRPSALLGFRISVYTSP